MQPHLSIALQPITLGNVLKALLIAALLFVGQLVAFGHWNPFGGRGVNWSRVGPGTGSVVGSVLTLVFGISLAIALLMVFYREFLIAAIMGALAAFIGALISLFHIR